MVGAGLKPAPTKSFAECESMTDNPLVSVIIPTFNRQAMVTEAVASVLAQAYAPFEVIVVDDGSTDATIHALAPYHNHIRLITQTNRGVSAARNRGIAAAAGEYIALLDSDDLWLPGKLACQIRFFTENPDALICQTQEIWMRKGVRVNPRKYHRKPSGMIFEPSLALCLVSPSAVMLRRNLFDRVGGFDETLPACEDYDLWLRISCRIPIYLIDQYRIIKRGGHADQLSCNWGLDRYRIQSLHQLLNAGGLSPAQHAAATTMLVKKCRMFAAGCRKHGHTQQAETYTAMADAWDNE